MPHYMSATVGHWEIKLEQISERVVPVWFLAASFQSSQESNLRVNLQAQQQYFTVDKKRTLPLPKLSSTYLPCAQPLLPTCACKCLGPLYLIFFQCRQAAHEHLSLQRLFGLPGWDKISHLELNLFMWQGTERDTTYKPKGWSYP